jgi:hypothetical protein
MAVAVSPNYARDELVFASLGAKVLKPLSHAREVHGAQRRPVWRSAELGDGAIAVTAIAPSPNFAMDNTIFAATNAGVFVSRDRGDSFQPWSENLYPANIVDLAISPGFADDRLIYGLGLGGTIWVRRDTQK